MRTNLRRIGPVAGTVWMYVTMPKGFLPQQDTGLLTATVEAPDDVSFSRMSALQAEVAAVIRADPEINAAQIHAR